MYKVICLAAVLAVATAKPSVYGEAVVPLAVQPEPVHVPVAPLPIIEKTIVQPAPIVEKTIVQPPPTVEQTEIKPETIAHTYRKDVIGKPIVSIHTPEVRAPVVASVVEKSIVQPAPVVQRTLVQPAPIVQTPLIQPAPIVQRTLVQPALTHAYSEYLPHNHYNPLPLDAFRLAPNYRGNYYW
ncbi:uncharacterized protein LOC109605035 [Aethina tumida]|uniref:uncharacterized protein LOC109605035 n=1 Tax=Aethina tumida TaxID=116153 RepID=UPI00096B6069|nr:uncharacterized protein LOC109605035 [Aethina tumida]